MKLGVSPSNQILNIHVNRTSEPVNDCNLSPGAEFNVPDGDIKQVHISQIQISICLEAKPNTRTQIDITLNHVKHSAISSTLLVLKA